MTEAPLEYASDANTRRSKLALFALMTTATAAAFLAFAFLEGSRDYDVFGFVSMPLAAIGSVVGLIAILRKSSRGVPAVISVSIALVYWAAVAAMIVPKLRAGR